ncbi:phosphoinositide 3-kinase regulatory subunit 6 isoform X2 [Siniperca chuatsi]|uniref:phosphoinositide 3-kinase regulatory subunit 6 isoform X2 n=1 Tax=Siniperca chuatsi TaxID=119488 RepID=UPI001CE1D196|nr:phosphoinositide 3-kinase regulatory subunit 6 isoform X2 [Siniperca chuatsi]
MVDPTDVAFSTAESSLYNNIQALLEEMNSQSASQKGMLRWSLQKMLEADPSCSVSLVRVLVKELEKLGTISKTQPYLHVIPMLHTLYYVVIQSGAMIPTSLYQTVHESLMKLLTLPSPYSAVALSTLRSIKMEMTTPGSLYQRRVMAEQNLKNEHFTLREKVFVLADPAVFSAPLEATVRAHLEVSSLLTNTSTVEKNVVLRVLQAGLGTTCQSSRLAQALEALGDHVVEKYFQEVAIVVEQSIKHGAGGRANYLNKLQHIYRDILTASKDEITKTDHGSSVCGTEMPIPEIKFLLWRDEEDLWNLLEKFTLRCSPHSSVDEEVKYKRHSVQSVDSGIERGLKESDFDDTERHLVRNPVSAFKGRNAFRRTKSLDVREKTEAFPGSFPVLKEDRRRHIARVVVMGDDRVLGRLTRAYHSIRERESKRLILTKKLNLQLYYIPVTAEPSLSSPDSPRQGEGSLSLASLLGRVDPLYNSNINGLGAEISKLAGMHSYHSQPSKDKLFLLDTLCYYLHCGTQPVNLPLYSVKMTRSSCNVSSVVEEVFVSHLEADVPEFRHLKEMSSKKPSAHRRKTVEVFGAVISVRYTKISLSKREVVKGEAPMACGVVISSEPAALTSGEDYLTVRFDSLNPGYNTKIKTQNITIRTMEQRTLSVCLDKDSRRTYTDVQRIEISPCLVPGCSIRSWFSISNDGELPLSKYLDTVLSLPINTFTGVTL